MSPFKRLEKLSSLFEVNCDLKIKSISFAIKTKGTFFTNELPRSFFECCVMGHH